MRIAIYARVSTADQTPDNQLIELRRYADARGWSVANEYIDCISGNKESRPALDQLTGDAKRRRFDVVLCWRLDRLGRSLRHLILLLDEWQSLGVVFVSLNEGLDATTPAGKLQLHVLAAIAEFERGRIQERVRAGLARARAKGKRLGRKPHGIPAERFASVDGLSLREAARQLGARVRSLPDDSRRKPTREGITIRSFVENRFPRSYLTIRTMPLPACGPSLE